MRTFLVIAAAALALASPAAAVETSDFNLRTTRDQVAVCSGEPEEELYAEALQFCYGFVAGVAQLHRMLVETGDTKPVACPRHEVTREALVAIVLDWTGANPGAMDLLPAESVARAAAATWPCTR
jgi:hypothetical protein